MTDRLHNESNTEIRVLLVDDDTLVRAGLKLILGAHAEIKVVGEAENGEVGVRLFEELRPDVTLMDIRMPERNGLSATETILASHPDANIVVLTTFDSDEFVLRALRSGARGFLLKDTEPAELIRSVRVAAQGKATLSPSVITQLVGHVLTPASVLPDVAASPQRDELAFAQVSSLTERELDVARAVARGLSNSEIAGSLFLSVPTVKTHLSRVFDKLAVDNRVQVALKITAGGFTSEPDA